MHMHIYIYIYIYVYIGGSDASRGAAAPPIAPWRRARRPPGFRPEGVKYIYDNMFMYVCIYIYICIYIYRERESQRDR